MTGAMTKEKTMELTKVGYEKEDFDEGSVATITLKKPETLNAMDVELTMEIESALTEAEEDDDVKVVILQGVGPAFSVGYDLGRVYYVYGGGTGKVEDKTRRPSQRARLKYDRWRCNTLRRVFLFPKVTIAKIHGYCIGGGLYVSLCCDLSIAAEDAKIGHAEQRLVFAGAMYVLPIEVNLIGHQKARELLLTGRLLDGKEAERIGLINRAVPADKLDEETRKLAQGITLLPRDGLCIGKAAAQLAYDSLGLTSSFEHGHITHSMSTNVRFEEDEFNFIKARRDLGTREAIKARDKRYKGLF
jgi:enoyl-CoA hydratase